MAWYSADTNFIVPIDQAILWDIDQAGMGPQAQASSLGRYPHETGKQILRKQVKLSRIENEVQQDTNTSRFQNSSNFTIFSPTAIDDRLTP